MTPKRLLEYFNEIAEAPDAVPRLRRFILDLAVRGKLVEQDPKDEPASELLKRIEEEKKRLVKVGKIRNEKPLPVIDEEATLFNLPASWKWVPIRKITADRGQKVPDKKFSYIDVSAIDKERGKIAAPQVLTPDEAPSRARKIVRKGDVIYSCVRPYLLNIAVVDEEFDPEPIVSTAFAVLNGLGFVLARYLWIVLRSPYFVGCVEEKMRGQAYPAINDGDFAPLPFPLPPLAEQHRIVAKVDELMALCDDLEAAQQKRERRRDRLVAVTLNGIGKDVSGRDGSPSRPNIPQLNTGAFGESALPNHDTALPKFFLNHLPRLTTRPEHIQQLRQTILNLAVYGKLVPQDPNEEPATDLLRKITAERLQLLQDKQMPVQKLVKPSSHLDDESRIPDSWQNCYLQDIAYQITDGTHLTPKYTDWGRPFLSAQNVKPFRFMPENHRYVSESDFEKYRANRKPERGDVLLTRVGAGIGESTVLDSDFEFAFYVSLCLIKIPAKLFLPHFLVIWLNSPIGRSNSTTRTYGKGFSQGNLNLGMIRTFRVPLPPLAEQHRIVVRVDEMMAVCDELEARLSTTTNIRGQLLEARLSEVLAIR